MRTGTENMIDECAANYQAALAVIDEMLASCPEVSSSVEIDTAKQSLHLSVVKIDAAERRLRRVAVKIDAAKKMLIGLTA